MQVIETFEHGKIADNSYSEDRLVISDNVAGVIDGSRGPGYMETDIIQQTLDEAVEYLQSLSQPTTPQNLTATLTSITRASKRKMGVDEDRYSGGFGFAIYIPDLRQVWRIGDCPVRFSGVTHLNEIELEFIAARQRAVMIHAMLVRGKSSQEVMASDEYANVFMPFFAPLLDFANNEDHQFGFGVINGLTVPEKFIQIITIPETVNELVITSDGYPKVFDTLAQTQTALNEMLARDPLCINENITSKGMLPGQISFDDRTYLKLAI